jgi:predicted nucleotidyltransferase
MLQSNYKFEILRELYKEPSHIRGIAKKVGTNQTTIARKAIELENENVIDYQIIGKNKVYSIKKSIEAEEHWNMLQSYKILKIIERFPELRGIITRIRMNPNIELALLYGSYAKGNANDGSDIDIFIETGSRKVRNEIAEIDSRISVNTGMLTSDSLLMQEILKENIIIKGKERYYATVITDRKTSKTEHDQAS